MPRPPSIRFNIASTVAVRGVIGVLMLGFTPVAIHALGQAEFGLYVAGAALVGYAVFFEPGLNLAAVRLLADSSLLPAERQALYATGLWLAVGFGLLGGFAYLAALPLLYRLLTEAGSHPQFRDVLLLVAGIVPLRVVLAYLNGVLTAAERIHDVNLGNLGGSLLRFGGGAAAALLGGSTVWLFLMVLLSHLLQVALDLWWIGRQRGVAVLGLRVDPRPRARRFLSIGLRAYAMNAFGEASSQVDKPFIAALLGPAAVTQYFVAHTLAIRIWDLSSAVSNSYYPRLVAARGEAGEFARTYRRGLGAMALLAAPPALLLALLADEVLRLWVGGAMAASSALLLRLLCLVALLTAPFSLNAAGLMALDRGSVLVVAFAAGSLAMAGLFPLLLPAFGLSGAALAFAGGYGLITIWTGLAIRSHVLRRT